MSLDENAGARSGYSKYFDLYLDTKWSGFSFEKGLSGHIVGDGLNMNRYLCLHE